MEIGCCTVVDEVIRVSVTGLIRGCCHHTGIVAG